MIWHLHIQAPVAYHLRLHEVSRPHPDRFGTNFSGADQLFFDQIRVSRGKRREHRGDSPRQSLYELRRVSGSYSGTNCSSREWEATWIFSKVLTDTKFRSVADEHLARDNFRRVRDKQHAEGSDLRGPGVRPVAP